MQPSTLGLRNGSLRYSSRNCGMEYAGILVRKRTAKARRRDIEPPPSLFLFEAHAGYVRVAIHQESPGFIFVLSGVIHPDARTSSNRPRIEFPVFDPNCGAE